MTTATTETTANKNTQKLQRAVVDGLEDVKAQDIVVFDTAHLSALFERVIIASGTSNRQTKALAASVRDAVREAGFPKPRIEGEGNGEWIIVDCAQVVVHIMQPNFRQYYHLEELWGEKPVRLKLGAAKPAAPAPSAAAKKAAPVAPTTLKRSNAAKKGVAEAFPSKAQLKRDADAAEKAADKAARASGSVKRPVRGAAGAGAGAAAPAAPVRAAAKSAVKPAAKPATKPVAKPVAKPAAKSADKSATKPATPSATQPAAKVAAKPAAKPAAKAAAKPAAKKAPVKTIVAGKPAAKPVAKAPAKASAKPAARKPAAKRST